jgi:hypothetical protein
MKINYCFLRGFALAERAKIPLEVVGDDGVLTLRKGQGLMSGFLGRRRWLR